MKIEHIFDDIKELLLNYFSYNIGMSLDIFDESLSFMYIR